MDDMSDKSSEDSEIESWLSKLEDLYRKKGERAEEAFKHEKDPLREYLRKAKTEINERECSICKLQQPYKIGGTAVIFEATHLNIQDQKLVFKFNRPLLSGDEMSQVENERNILPSMDHPNIIRVYDAGEFEVEKTGQKLSYVVEPFIHDVLPLDDYIGSLSKGIKRLNASLADRLLRRLVSPLRQWVKALLYIHRKKNMYLDVKPDNTIVDKEGHLYVIDFGSVQTIDNVNPNESINVFFDGRFAHPELLVKASYYSKSRLKKAIRRRDLRPEFDLYALGKSILYLLKVVAREHPHDLPQRPLFRSLHFLATRLLDGKNEESYSREDIIGETFGSLTRSDYSSIKYTNLEDVLRDLEKEYGYWNPEDVVPELATFSKDVVREIAGMNTVLTNRLKAVIQHPLVARLKAINQLGLVSLVYPTAEYWRLDHSLGTFTYTVGYIKALFEDSQNPIFRNLVDEQDIKAVLLAALLHDLGQYPLAHDLGEVHELIFKHTYLTESLLSDQTKDKKGRTLLDIVKDDHDGWGVEPDWLRKILELSTHESKKTLDDAIKVPSNAKEVTEHSTVQSEILVETDTVRNFKADMLSALIDGPIDADKADYLTRDSEQCKLTYGKQLDIERLLRVLTTVRIPGGETSHNIVTIGVYEKGRASAESFGFARYLLHSSVYWHHTSRILKAMLQYATALVLPDEVFQVSRSGNARIREIQENLLLFVKKLTPPFKMVEEERITSRPLSKTEKPEMAPPDDVFNLVTGASDESVHTIHKDKLKPVAETWSPGISWTDWLMLNWLKSLSKSSKAQARTEAAALIESIKGRDLYKRVCTISRGSNKDLVGKLDRLSWLGRIELCRKVQAKIYQFITERGPKVETRPLTSSDEVERLFKTELVILIDVPDPKKLTTDKRPLVYVSELHRKTYYQESESPIMADDFMHSMDALMNSISPIRVLCHPRVHQWISICVDQVDIIEAIRTTIGEVF